MKLTKIMVLASLITISSTYAEGPGVGGGGSTSQILLVNAVDISDVRLRNENIVRFEELLKDKAQFKIQSLSDNIYKIDLNQSDISDIQLIDGSIISGDMGGGGAF